MVRGQQYRNANSKNELRLEAFQTGGQGLKTASRAFLDQGAAVGVAILTCSKRDTSKSCPVSMMYFVNTILID